MGEAGSCGLSGAAVGSTGEPTKPAGGREERRPLPFAAIHCSKSAICASVSCVAMAAPRLDQVPSRPLSLDLKKSVENPSFTWKFLNNGPF